MPMSRSVLSNSVGFKGIHMFQPDIVIEQQEDARQIQTQQPVTVSVMVHDTVEAVDQYSSLNKIGGYELSFHKRTYLV